MLPYTTLRTVAVYDPTYGSGSLSPLSAAVSGDAEVLPDSDAVPVNPLVEEGSGTNQLPPCGLFLAGNQLYEL